MQRLKVKSSKQNMFSETKEEDQTMIAYRESDVLENIEEEDSGIPLPPKVAFSLLSCKHKMTL